MKKNKILGLLASTALIASFSSVANSQITISGHVEASYMVGTQRVVAGSAAVNQTKQLGNETVIKFASKGKMSNGIEYNVFQDIASDQAHVLHGRQIEISPTKNINVGYSFDGVKGGEIARTATPFATNRLTDITGASNITEPLDVSSGEHFVYFDLNNLIGANSQLSVAYAPNLDSTSNNGSDRFITTTATNSGYGVGYKITPIAGLSIAAGMTRIDQNSAGHQDVNMRTLGATYAQGPFAVGIQRYRQEGLKTSQAATHEDRTTIISATFAATKQLTVGISRAEQERTLAGSRSTTDTEARAFSIGYNLGPVVVSYDFEQNQNVPVTATTAAIAGRDTDSHKVRVRANF